VFSLLEIYLNSMKMDLALASILLTCYCWIQTHSIDSCFDSFPYLELAKKMFISSAMAAATTTATAIIAVYDNSLESQRVDWTHQLENSLYIIKPDGCIEMLLGHSEISWPFETTSSLLLVFCVISGVRLCACVCATSLVIIAEAEYVSRSFIIATKRKRNKIKLEK